MSCKPNRLWIVGLLFLLGAWRLPCAAVGAEVSKELAAIPSVGHENAPPNGRPAEQPDPFLVPDGTPEELLTYIEGLKEVGPKAFDRDGLTKHRKDLAGALVKAAEKILAAKPNDEQADAAVHFRIIGLNILEELGDAEAGKKFESFPAELEKAGLSKLARMARGFVLQKQLSGIERAGPGKLGKLIEEVKKHLASGPLASQEISLAMTAAQLAEMTGNTKMAVEAYKSFGKLLSANSGKQAAYIGAKMLGSARRLGLVGNKMHLEGAFLDGKPLDWKSYRGKVVLVQYWATWCGPCRHEIENVKKSYQLYHDRGFEVIGINCDDDRKPLEDFLEKNPLPWKNLFSTDPDAKGMDNPMADYYGVMGIPTLILVGKDGNVVSLHAQGPRLDKELARLLGPAEQTELEPSEKKQ